MGLVSIMLYFAINRIPEIFNKTSSKAVNLLAPPTLDVPRELFLDAFQHEPMMVCYSWINKTVVGGKGKESKYAGPIRVEQEKDKSFPIVFKPHICRQTYL